MFTLTKAAITASALALMLAPAASAHNRAHVILPTGECIIVGSEKSVVLPDGTLLDLDPYLAGDEIGTSFAALQGGSRLEKGPCPQATDEPEREACGGSRSGPVVVLKSA